MQQDILETFVDRGQLRTLTQPTVLPNGKRIPGLKLDHPRLGYRIVRTSGKSKLSASMIQRWNSKGLIAYPTRKSIRRFRDRARVLTRRSAQRKTAALIQELNPTLRGWGEYYKTRLAI